MLEKHSLTNQIIAWKGPRLGWPIYRQTSKTMCTDSTHALQRFDSWHAQTLSSYRHYTVRVQPPVWCLHTPHTPILSDEGWDRSQVSSDYGEMGKDSLKAKIWYHCRLAKEVGIQALKHVCTHEARAASALCERCESLRRDGSVCECRQGTLSVCFVLLYQYSPGDLLRFCWEGDKNESEPRCTHPRFKIADVKPHPILYRKPWGGRILARTLVTSFAALIPSSFFSDRLATNAISHRRQKAIMMGSRLFLFCWYVVWFSLNQHWVVMGQVMNEWWLLLLPSTIV